MVGEARVEVSHLIGHVAQMIDVAIVVHIKQSEIGNVRSP